MSRLGSIGLGPERLAEAERLRVGELQDAVLGRVGRVDRGEVLVLAETVDIRALSDSQRTQDQVAPVTGDWVLVTEDPDLGPVIAQVLDRCTAIVRRDPAENAVDQVLVSNVDRVGVVQGLDQPANAARVERFLVLAIDSGADPLVVLTKSDIARAQPSEYGWLKDLAPVVVTSAGPSDPSGIRELAEHVGPGETLVFIGPSGSGKSTLANALVGAEVAETSHVRESDRRGRHTTTVRELIELPTGGALIDTPGIRAVGLWAADIALDEVFADIVAVATDCRFRDCTHRHEPGCAVQHAIEAGELSAQRLARYQMLWQELAIQAEEIERQNRSPRRGRR